MNRTRRRAARRLRLRPRTGPISREGFSAMFRRGPGTGGPVLLPPSALSPRLRHPQNLVLPLHLQRSSFAMMLRLLPLFVILTASATPAAAAASPSAPDSPLSRVNTFIGTEGEGLVHPGASLPFGYMQPGPETGPGSGSTGYKFRNQIVAFSQQRISGMGGPILGEISVFPLTGEVANPSQVISTGKSRERATPGYYTVTLAPWNVTVELTPGRRIAYHRHTFPAHERARVLFDVGHCLYGIRDAAPPSGSPFRSWSSAYPIGGEFTLDPAKREISGRMTYAGGRSTREPWTVYFAARFDTTPTALYTWSDSSSLQRAPATIPTIVTGAEIGAIFELASLAEQQIETRVAVSWRSVEHARAYLEEESSVSFDAARAHAASLWQETLSRIELSGATREQARLFYTALYRAHLTPNDWTGEAPLPYGDAPYYENILCLWDTFRTPYPLLTLLRPDVIADIVNTLLAHYRVKGWTGDAHSAHQFEHVQNGSNADVVIADAYVKKIPGIDWSSAYTAIRKNAFEEFDPTGQSRPYQGRFRLHDYLQHRYLPTDSTSLHATQAVSRTLEYAHNDHAVLTLACDFGTPSDVAVLQDRALWYRNLFDSSVGFFRGRSVSGAWHSPFDPLLHETGRQYYEGHAWTWLWYVPHDPAGLIELLGGDTAFVEKLRTACEAYYEPYNEPGMLQTYLFIHAGRPDLTQHYSRYALRHFNLSVMGLPGNDDSGTTSAWLVWTMLGLYPNAGQDFYYLGSPSFPEATLHLPSGKRIVLRAPATSSFNRYVAGVKLNGQPLDRAWVRHAELIDGAILEFDMVESPTDWGRSNRPPSYSIQAKLRDPS